MSVIHLDIAAHHVLGLLACLQMVAAGLVGLWALDRRALSGE